MLSLFLLVLLFAFGTQVVLSDDGNKDFKVNIVNVTQCAPVFLNFTGTKPRSDGIITQVQVVPINSTAMSVPVPQVNITDGGIQLSFLPVKADDTFVSSDTSCLVPPTNQKAFTLVNEPRQCEAFTIASNGAVQVSNDGQGVATYKMDLKRGQQFVLLIQGGADNKTMETTSLLTVGGEASSPSDCFNKGNSTGSKTKDDNDKDKDGGSGLSKKTVIGLAIGGSIVALIACVMVAYLMWERRNRRRVSIHFDPSLLEKRSLPPSAPQSEASTPRPQIVSYNQASSGYVQNPPYTSNTVMTRKSSLSSERELAGRGLPQMNRGSTYAPDIRTSPSSSLNSFTDIEGILNSQEQRVQDELSMSPLPSPTASLMKSPGAPVFAQHAQPARAHLTRADSATLSRQPSTQSSIVDPYTGVNRASSNLLQPPLPAVPNKSHFSAMTTSSFGGGFDTEDRISGVPDSVASPTSTNLPPRRPLPAATCQWSWPWEWRTSLSFFRTVINAPASFHSQPNILSILQSSNGERSASTRE
ncbi:hypothetical protein DL96DRAFT_1712085 [Flagelloscypha sp. PMI_526]|nr:hypothetical protein DL96DRAFT_1712085 [Flagelloscypha sp. PMI_526]